MRLTVLVLAAVACSEPVSMEDPDASPPHVAPDAGEAIEMCPAWGECYRAAWVCSDGTEACYADTAFPLRKASLVAIDRASLWVHYLNAELRWSCIELEIYPCDYLQAVDRIVIDDACMTVRTSWTRPREEYTVCADGTDLDADIHGWSVSGARVTSLLCDARGCR